MVELKKNNFKILVVGCGGTGSQLLSNLMQICSNTENVIAIILADGDVFESKNLSNQRCTLQDIGKNKAKACSERYKMIYPNLKIKYADKYIKSIDDVITVFGQGNYYQDNDCYYLIIGAVDNNATRKILHSLFKINTKAKIIYIDSGNESGEDFNNRNGQVITGLRHREDIILPDVGMLYKEIEENNDDIENVGTCMRFSNEHPQNIATNMMAANIISSILTNILMFYKIENNITYFDADKITAYSRI